MDSRITKIGVIAVMIFVVSAVGVGQVADDSQTGEDTQTFAVTQGDTCYTIQPLGNGTKSVVSFYGYRAAGYGYSSTGTRQLQIEDASQFFFYQGNGGLSLVMLHDKTNGSGASGGGTVTFLIDGLPITGGWVVKDDDYPGSNDSFTFNGSTSVVTWSWQGNRSDGGAYQAEPSQWDSPIRIVPHFNRESKAYPNPAWADQATTNQVERWIVRSGNGQAYALNLYQPVVIRQGTCGSLSPPDKEQSTPTEQNASTEQNSPTEQSTTTTTASTASTDSTEPSRTTTQSGTEMDVGGSIATGPGFGIGVAILALLVVLVVVFRRR